MNTYLFSKPSFTSPQPLAASSGLTIPLQITLSEIKLSAFIILVFSRQKGLTLVFRNDPLESMKVSSTFDSIPFVSEYLQKTIEQQVRTLMMEELPAIIHRLSLRLWCPDYAAKEEQERAQEEAKKAQQMAADPLASPPMDAVDWSGNVVEAADIEALSLEEGIEGHSLFSQKNLLRLGALNDSQRTLSLFTPSISDAVFRAWAGPAEKELNGGIAATPMPTLTRTMSHVSNGATTYTFSDHGSESAGMSSRPSMVHLQSAPGLSLGSGSRRTHGRKKKHRVVNLRKKALVDETQSEMGDTASESASEFSSVMGGSEPLMMHNSIPEEPENASYAPRSPVQKAVRFNRNRVDSIDLGEMPHTLRHIPHHVDIQKMGEKNVQNALASVMAPNNELPMPSIETEPPTPRRLRPTLQRSTSTFPSEKSDAHGHRGAPISYVPYEGHVMGQGGIIEQAWMMSMAAELARRAHLRKEADDSEFGVLRDETPPPAYGA